MRPLQLTFTAFGPYADPVHINFETLSERGVFLVHGPTGAGKTTLLDAMSFALYGVTSGGERSAKQMRSDFARREATSEVTLTFSARDALYRVHRIPEQERKKKRGDGVTTAKGEVRLSLLRRDENGREVEDTLATKVADVDQRIRDLLGLTAEQFRQVVVLPQGRFRELLVASSAKRQEILESLFGAERIRAIEDALSLEEKTRREDVRRLEAKRTLVQEHAAADGITDLDTEKEAVARAIERFDAEQVELVEKGRSKRLEHATFIEAVAAQDALLAATLAWKAWEEGDTRREEEAARLASAERSAAIRAELEGVDAAKAHVVAVSQRLAANEADWATAADAVKTSEATLSALQSAIPQSGDEGEALREALPQLVEAERLALVGHRAKEEHKTAEHDHQTVKTDLVAAQTALDAAKEERNQAQQLALRVDQRRDRLLATMRAEQQLKKAKTAADLAASEAQTHRQLQAEFDDVASRHATDVERLDAVRTRRAASSAAALAAGLEAGTPCPVCGSPDHPAPQSLPTDEETGDGELDLVAIVEAGAKRCASLEAALSATMQNHQRALERLRGGLDAMQVASVPSVPAANGAEVIDLHPIAAAIEAALASTSTTATAEQEQLEEAEAAHDAMEGLRQKAATTKQEVDHLTRSLAALAERVSRTLRDGEEAEGTLGQHLEAFPLAREMDHATALRRLRDLDAAKAKRGQVLASAQMDVATKKAAAQTAEALLAAATRDKEGAFAKQRDAEERLRTALKQSGFESAAEAQQAALDPPALTALKRAVEEAARDGEKKKQALALRKEAANALASRLDGSIDGAAVEQARVAVDAVESDIAALAQARGRAVERHANLVRWGDDLATIETELLGAREAHAAIAPLAAAATGHNAQKITFQRWVLATLLDDVLETASVRLLRMTRGRYALKRRLDPRGRGGRGLDLDVVDHETQAERPVATLSGGESFLAALALALGLADAVRARAGGVLLDAIFLDEGFAGLDPEALDLALATLQELMDSGRMVGMISHVDELKERIPHGLEVKTGRRGSRVITFGH